MQFVAGVHAVCCRVLQSVAESCRVLQSLAVCCSVLQCVAVCSSVLCLQPSRHHSLLPLCSMDLYNYVFIYMHTIFIFKIYIYTNIYVYKNMYLKPKKNYINIHIRMHT